MKADIDDYKIFENRIIKSEKHEQWQVDEKFGKIAISDKYLKLHEQYKSVAFVIIQNGKLKYEHYWEGYSDTSYSNSFSMAKSIVGLLIGIAVDEGKIKSLDQPASDFLPQFKNNPDLTIKNILTMSSGLNWDESYASLTSITTKAYYGNDIEAIINDMKITGKPGDVFNYQSGNTLLLASILEKATGMHVAEYASEKLWKKIGASNDAIWSLDHKDGHEKAYCRFNSNARDFARFGQLILNKGKWDSTQVISEKYIEESVSPAIYNNEADPKGISYKNYGFQWWIIDYKDMRIPYMRGLSGQYVFVIKEKNAVVVRLGEKRSDQIVKNAPEDCYWWLDAAMEVID
jgi:CubicO group peptidase (beta-lactamase class C family)